MSRAVRLLVLAMVAAGTTSCARLQARSTAGPPLEVPAPPARAIAPIEDVVVAEAPAPAPAAVPSTRAASRPPASTAPRAERADPLPSTPAPVQPEPPRTLQTTANVEATERRIRTTLAEATRNLARIDYRGLSVEGRAQYDIAKRFGEQAEEALAAKNLLFASQLADKASVLAALLTK